MRGRNRNSTIESVEQRKSLFSQLPWYYTVSGLIIAPISSVFSRIIHAHFPIDASYIHLSDISLVFLVLLFVGSHYIQWLKKHNTILHFAFLTSITIYAWTAFQTSSMQTSDYLSFIMLFFICNTFFSRYQYYLFYVLIVLTLLGFSYVNHTDQRGVLLFILLGVFYCGVGNMIAFYFRSRIIDKHKKHSKYLSKVLNHPGIGYALLYINDVNAIQIKDDNTSIYPLLQISNSKELIELLLQQLDKRKINNLIV